MSAKKHITQQVLESYLWGAAVILRGLVDAGDYKQFVFPLLFYMRLSDVWDEDFAEALEDTGDEDYAKATADERFVIPAGAHWEDVRTVPRGRADYAFFQHILESLDPVTGRCAILFPHGVLFRNEEAEMRRKLVERDLVDCVLGLGPNLFYNSPMEACIVVCRTRKPPERRGKVLFIDAVAEVARERAQSFLKPEHQEKILASYRGFEDLDGFAKVATLEEVAQREHSLSIPLYVRRPTAKGNGGDERTLRAVWAEWEEQGRGFWQEMDSLAVMLDGFMQKGSPVR